MRDHARILLMARTGFPTEMIAERLNVSKRTVRRVLRGHLQETTPCAALGTADEPRLWEAYRAQGHSSRHIAYRFGLDRRTMDDHFNRAS